jgi:hypothetical protein
VSVVGDPEPVHQGGEGLRADEVAADRVLEVVAPVDGQGAGEVPAAVGVGVRIHQDPAASCSFVRDRPVIGATILAHQGELDRARALADVVGDPTTDLDTASAWQARFATASGDPATARRISVDKAKERRLYGQQQLLALLEALVALEDWPAVVGLLPRARAWVDGNALLAPFCDRAEGSPTPRPARRPRPPGRCWRPPWRATSGGSACAPSGADRRGREPRPTAPRSCG